ncbi:tetratricopeptide repeat protein [Aquabacterium parvum]|uniref:tetratricopeptide repeat protein n=1 Tax=Aquabacterium parvum TaxID=70584 RepID=UPI000718CFFF|nr:tetratricopeptide repeat protein [Aquabacterium parvum]
MHEVLKARDKNDDAENSPLHDLRNARALVIDVNPTSRSILKGMLVDLGVPSDRVKQVGRYNEARSELETTQYDVVLCDYHFNDTQQTGADLIEELRQGNNLPYATVFIMVTSEASYSRVAEAAESALDCYLLKPHTHNDLAARLRVARHRKQSLADIFQAMQEEDFQLAAGLCQARFEAKVEYWIYAARIGGELLLRLNRHDEAKELFEAIDATKAMPWARLGVARAQLDSGQMAPAKRILESLIVDNPTYADAYDVMGRANFQSGDFDAAYETYRHAVSLTPSSLSRLQKMGLLAFHLGKTDEATQVLERATALGVTSRMFDFQTLVMLSLSYFEKQDGKSLQKSLNQIMQAHEKAPRSARLRRMHEMVNVLSLMLQRQVADVVRRVKNMTREFAQPDYDFETAGNMMSLLLKLRASELELPDAELWIEKLARRFCINKGMTDMLAMMVHAHEPYEALVRESYKRLVTLAETSLSKAKAGQANGAIAELVSQGTTTGNTRMIELADMLRQRYQEQGLDADLLQKLEELQARYVRKPAPIKASR